MTAEAFEASKRRTYQLLNIQEGHRILDVGCGTGQDVRSLAQLVGSSGRVTGIDSSEAMVSEALKRMEGEALPVEYLSGDAHNLDFPDQAFDGCRAYHVLMHLEDPRKALAEVVRVTRSGGRIVLCEPDLETWMIDAPNRSVTRRILNFRCDGFRSGWVGRQLPALFSEIGITDISIEPVTLEWTDYAWTDQRFGLHTIAERAKEAGVVSADEAAEWLGYLEEAGRTGRFFAAFTMFTVSGHKP
ncbi:MAG: class I SAM-dependent methyltransferase [Dehalococcoidia bacterium]|nr:class I SAM-dependent methyltransferase [Dehalococcoidia bacterium]